jgi:hypothetical protein
MAVAGQAGRPVFSDDRTLNQPDPSRVPSAGGYDPATFVPPGGQTSEAFFAGLTPGTPVAGQAGQFWQHNPQTGWGWGTSATGTPGAGTGAGTGAASNRATTLGGFDVSVADAPGFNAPARATPGVAMPTLGNVDAYTGPTAFQMPGYGAAGSGYGGGNPRAIDPATGRPYSMGQQEQTPDWYDPGARFRLDEASKAMDRAAAAHGTLRGGAQVRGQGELAANLGSQEYQAAFNRAKTVTDTNAGLASDAYDRGRLERDARFDAATGTWNRDSNERNTAYDAAYQNAQAAYKPGYDTWAARSASAQHNAELQYVNPWEKEQFGANLAQRRSEADANDAYRRSSYSGDDAYRYYMANQQNQQFLASLGNY